MNEFIKQKQYNKYHMNMSINVFINMNVLVVTNLLNILTVLVSVYNS